MVIWTLQVLTKQNDVIFIYDNPNTVSNETLRLTARPDDHEVLLSWATQSETGVAGFDIEKMAPTETATGFWKRIGYVAGSGTTSSPRYYSFTDTSHDFAGVAYRLKMVHLDGSYSYSNVVEVGIDLRQTMTLQSTYPNPFSESVTIEVGTGGPIVPTLSVFDLTGRRVRARIGTPTRVDDRLLFTIERTGLSDGVYFVHATTTDRTLTIPIIVAR